MLQGSCSGQSAVHTRHWAAGGGGGVAAAHTKTLRHKAAKEMQCLVTAGGEKTIWAH